MASKGYKKVLADHGLRFVKAKGHSKVAEKSYGDDRLTVTAQMLPNGKLKGFDIRVDAKGHWRAFMEREASVLADAIRRDKPEVSIVCSVVK